MDVVDITILGSKKQIENKVAELGIAFDFSKVKIISPIKSEHYEDYVNTYYELRKKKNVTLEGQRFNGRWVLFWNYDGL
jgi:phosphate acetyltransferase